jgi:hypothetical protein
MRIWSQTKATTLFPVRAFFLIGALPSAARFLIPATPRLARARPRCRSDSLSLKYFQLHAACRFEAKRDQVANGSAVPNNTTERFFVLRRTMPCELNCLWRFLPVPLFYLPQQRNSLPHKRINS